jgi:hypothetical protein
MSKPAAIVLPLIALAMFAVFYVNERLPANNHVMRVPNFPRHTIQRKPIAPWPATEFCAEDGDNGRVCVRPIPPDVIERKASEFDDKNGGDY